MSAMGDAVTCHSKLNVCLRIKPTKEKNDAYFIQGNKIKVLRGADETEFKFSNILSENSSQAEVFEQAARNAVESFLDGQDSLVFAYGTTNAGKTFSVQGSKSEPGIVPRSIKQVFCTIGNVIDEEPRFAPLNYKQTQVRDNKDMHGNDLLKRSILQMSSHNPSTYPPIEGKFSISFAPVLSSTICDLYDKGSSPIGEVPEVLKNSSCSLWISMLEVYNENVYDLLAAIPKGQSAAKSNVKILSDGIGNFIPHGNVEIPVNNAAEADAVMRYGQEQRTTVATLLNVNSSRSHCILRIRLLKVDRVGSTVAAGVRSPGADIKDMHVSTLMFIDLAGAERSVKAGTSNQANRARETGNINNSLVVLSRCMETLRLKGSSGTTSKNSVVPYRESKLTMILQPLLSVSGPKSLLVNINTSPLLFDETINVLKFSCVAKLVNFKEPPAPVPRLRIPTADSAENSQNSVSVSDTESNKSSDISSDRFNSVQAELQEEKQKNLKLEHRIIVLEQEFKRSQAENEKVMCKLKQCKDNLSNREAEFSRVNAEYGSMLEEMQAGHESDLKRTEDRLLTLMENRLDVNENHYKNLLEKNEAKEHCWTSYVKTLEAAILDWEQFSANTVSKEEYGNVCKLADQKNAENERLSKIVEENQLEIFKLKEIIDAQRDSQQSAIQERLQQDEDLTNEIDTLQKEVKRLVAEQDNSNKTIQEKEIKVQCLRETKKKMKETLDTLSVNSERYKKLAEFVVNEYHPGARSSLATHNEEETWDIIQNEFNIMPTRCRQLERENEKMKNSLELAHQDYIKLEERRTAQINKYEEEMRIKSNQLEVEKREVLALQKQLMGMTPRKLDVTPQKFKTPMAALSTSVRSMNLNSPSPSVSSRSANKTMPAVKFDEFPEPEQVTKSSGRRKKPVHAVEKENSPLPVEKPTPKKSKGTSRRKLCTDSLHPALLAMNDSEEVVDFKLPEENDLQRTRRMLRSNYK